MTAYYNDVEPFVVNWLTNLSAANKIAPGVVDGRSIEDVTAAELSGYAQVHTFAGIGGWSAAIRRAGVPDDFPVWTGSCPCQPFSGAGQREGVRDPRHLWPAWFALIQECRPGLIFGEQVASTDGLAWLDLVYADLERCGYTVGATDICAAGVGAPHNRSRLYFVAYTDEARRAIVGAPWLHDLRAPGHDVTRCGPTRVVGDAGRDRDEQHVRDVPRDESEHEVGTAHRDHAPFAPSEADVVADAARTQRTREEWDELQPPRRFRSSDGHGTYWSDAEWLYCTDEVYRPVEPGTSPLAPSRRGRVGRLRGYGNSINIEVATEFICASLEAIAESEA